MNSGHTLDAFDLDYNETVDDEIRAILRDDFTLVQDRDANLAMERKLLSDELDTEGSLVCGFR